MGSVRIAYVARFDSVDEPAVVAAALSCPYCLRNASRVLLGPSDGDGTSVAHCRCNGCDEAWLIVLNSAQALRLRIHPPVDVVIG